MMSLGLKYLFVGCVTCIIIIIININAVLSIMYIYVPRQGRY